MRMITDARSQKVGQVAATTRAGAVPAAATGGGPPPGSAPCELVWWFAKSSEQYRVTGGLELVGPHHPSHELVEARKQQWGNLSDNAREQFFWEAQPGETFRAIKEENGIDSAPPGGRGPDGKVVPPPETFLLMLLWPRQVKYLRLTDNYSQVDMLGGNEGWSSKRVNP